MNGLEKIASEKLEKWFWTFKHKLVDDFPEYRITFDYLITDANQNNLLYKMFETAYEELESVGVSKGGLNNLILTDYIKSLEYGYNKWLK